MVSSFLSTRPALALPAAALVSALAFVFTAPAAHAQANLTFSGGSGSPLTLSLAAPVTYTVTSAGSTSPLFLFQGVGNLFGGSRPNITGTISYRINNGAIQSFSTINSGFNTPNDLKTNDVYIFGSFPGVSVNDIVTLSSGTLTTTSKVAAAPPASGSFTTFLFASGSNDGARISNNGVSVAVAAPEPGSLSLLGMGLVSGLGVVQGVRRRKAGKAAA